MCERCHQVPIPPLARLERPLADTHGEWAAWREATGRSETCADCHMPGGSHRFPGATDAALLRSGLGVEVEVVEAADAEQIRVTLHNRAGHRFPSADPARALVVRAGQREEVLARRVPLPRLRDEGDTTLLPGETRTIELPRDPGVDRVEVVLQPLRFFAVPPPEGVPTEVLISATAIEPSGATDLDPG